jgi:SH3-like domain-containing protein
MAQQIKIIFMMLFLTILSYSIAYAEMVSIKGNNINLRSGPGVKYKVLWELGDGFPLKVLKKESDWLRVSDFEGTVGWIHSGVVEKNSHMIVKVHKKSKKQINIRSGPGTKYKIIAKAYYGVVFKTLKRDDTWIEIEHEKGIKGWVSSNLLWGW